MRFEDEIQVMLDFGSDLYVTRKDCLNHLFCTIGTGYEWVNGELVSHDFDDCIDRYKMISVEKAIEKPGAQHKWEERENRYKIMSAKAKNPDMREHRYWYPISKNYSPLLNYPEDIKPDWLAGINECKQLMIEDGFDFSNLE